MNQLFVKSRMYSVTAHGESHDEFEAHVDCSSLFAVKVYSVAHESDLVVITDLKNLYFTHKPEENFTMVQEVPLTVLPEQLNHISQGLYKIVQCEKSK